VTDKIELKPVLEQPADQKQAMRATQDNFRALQDWVRKFVDEQRVSYARTFMLAGS
jgi:hypothetical protein